MADAKVKPGDTLPTGRFYLMGEKGPIEVASRDIFKGTFVLFGLPGFHDLDWALDHLREKIQDGLALGLVAETEEKKGGIFI